MILSGGVEIGMLDLNFDSYFWSLDKGLPARNSFNWRSDKLNRIVAYDFLEAHLYKYSVKKQYYSLRILGPQDS